MVNATLVNFIKSSRAKGYKDDVIRKALANKGWDSNSVSAAFSAARASPVATKPNVASSSFGKQPFYKSRGFLIAIVVAIVLVVMGLGLLLLFSGDGEVEEEYECTRDSECRSGYECVNNECEFVEEEEETIDEEIEEDEEEVVEDTEEEEEVECVSDVDCTDLYGNDYYCLDSVCEYDSGLGLELDEEEEFIYYSVTGVTQESLNTSEASFLIDFAFDVSNYENYEEGENVTALTFVDCELFEEVNNISSSDSVEIEHSIEDTVMQTLCTMDVSEVYDVLDENVTVSILVIVDGAAEIEAEATWTLEDFGVEEEEACYENSDCEKGYVCVADCTSDVCYDSLGTCYEDSDGDGLADSLEATKCSVDKDCDIGYACNVETKECNTDCKAGKAKGSDDLCSEGYSCSEEFACEKAVSKVEETCSSDLDCAEGYHCNDDTVCEKRAEKEEACYSNSDCEKGYVCVADCTGEICYDSLGACYEDSDGDGVADTEEIEKECTLDCGAFDCIDDKLCYEECSDNSQCADDYICAADGESYCITALQECVGEYDIESAGEVTGISYYDGSYIGSGDWVDSCDENRQLVEYYCPGEGERYEGFAYEEFVDCTELGEDYVCDSGACVESEDFPRCSDGLDNDGDGLYDYYGACDCDGDSVNDVDIERSALSQSLCEAEPGTIVGGYDAWCEGQAGTWYGGDDACDSEDDNSEGDFSGEGLKQTRLSLAPEEDKNILEKIWSFFISAPVESVTNLLDLFKK